MADFSRRMNRRAVALALASAGLATAAGARERTPKERRACRTLSIGFDYKDLLDDYGLPAVGTGNVAFDMAQVIAPVVASKVMTAVDEPENPCKRARLEGIVDQWVETIGGDELAMIYYAGHGAVLQGRFHIVTPDPALVPFQDILDRVSERRPNAIVAFIDACRVPALDEANVAAAGVGAVQRPILPIRLDGKSPNAPRAREADAAARNAAQGENGENAIVGRGQNLALIYSTEIFQEATAGQTDSWSSPFADAFLKYFGARVDVMTLFSLIAGDVPGQEPWVSSNLDHRVFIAGEAPRYGRARDAWLNIPH